MVGRKSNDFLTSHFRVLSTPLFLALPLFDPSTNGQSWIAFASTECAYVRSNTEMFLLIDTNGVPKSTDLLSVPSSDVSLNIDFSLASP